MMSEPTRGHLAAGSEATRRGAAPGIVSTFDPSTHDRRRPVGKRPHLTRASHLTRVEHTDNLDFLGTIPNDSVRLVVTSPPYNLGKDYERRSSMDRYLAAQAAVIAEVRRALHPSGSICWQVGNYVANGAIKVAVSRLCH